jgi:general secretion pathway protein A
MHTIRAREAKAAIKELAGRSDISRYAGRRKRGPVFILSLLLAVLVIFIFYHFKLSGITAGRNEKSEPVREKGPVIPLHEREKNLLSRQNIPKPDTVPRPPEDLAGFLRRLEAASSRKGALKAVLKLWGTEATIRPHLENMENDTDFFRIAAIQNGFSSQPIQNDIELVKKLNLPAILKCYLPENLDPRYVVINSLDGRSVTLESGTEDTSIKALTSELKSYWSGSGYILWKNSLGLVAAPPLRLSKDSVITLKMVLQDIGFSDIQINPFYDRQTEEAIKQIQAMHGLGRDGIVGPLTKIVLNSKIKSSGVPHISKRRP